MKFEKEATTKNGRRTWKVTYELVRGPEPKPRRKAEKTPMDSKEVAKSEAKKSSRAKQQGLKLAPKATERKKGQARKDTAEQLAFL